MHYAKITAIIAGVAILSGTMFSLWNNSASQVLKRNSEKLEQINQQIESKREERKTLTDEFTRKDTVLSGAINELKVEAEKLKLCVDANSLCDGTEKKEAMLELIPTTYADTYGTASGAIVPPPERNICTIGTGSHDVRHLAKNYPGIAGWKNNNVSGITLGSKALERAFDDAGILWYVGTARPANEGSNYYGFPDLENGMKAKLLIIRRSYKNSSISSYLRAWGTDSIKTHLDTSRTIASLSDDELLHIIRAQIKKESGTLSNYIFTHVITCN